MNRLSTPIKFEIYEGDRIVRTEILAEPTIKIGKLASSHLRIDDESVSRMHAVIEVSGPDQVVVLDLGSATGTFVNGERITKRVLRSGDSLTVGSVKVAIEVEGQATPRAAAQAARVAQRPAPAVALFDDDESGGPRALEVLALWGPTVVDVTHFNSDGKYLIGEAKNCNQFVDTSNVPQDPFPLASLSGGDMVVNVPSGTQGEVMLDGKVYQLDELRAAGKLTTGPAGSSSLRLPARARCRLQFGELTFLVNSVAAARKPHSAGFWQQLDPQLMRYIVAAFMLHALFYVIVKSIPEGADGLSMDGFDASDRFVEFILKPEDEQEEKTKNLFEDLGEAAAKAKDDEGSMGKKDSTERDRKFAVKGPVDQKDIQLAKSRARTEALRVADSAFNQLEGELQAVWGTGDRAVGSDAISALGNMMGERTGVAQGFAGLGAAGGGRGGGGFGEASIGVGNVGTRGRGGKGGNGNYGRGVTRTGRRKTKVPKIIPGKPTIQGSLDKETIRRVIRRHRNEYRYCYEKELNRKRDLNGKIIVKFTISGNGSVIASGIASSTMKNANVEKCLKKKIRRWVFPAPKGGGIVLVKYPFIFKPS